MINSRALRFRHSLKLIRKYLVYLIRSGHRKGHRTHSPFIYNFVSRTLYGKDTHDFSNIEGFRRQLGKNKQHLPGQTFGAGSLSVREGNPAFGHLATKAAARPKYGRLLNRMLRDMEVDCVLELGTGLGISAAYMAVGNPDVRIHTIEGNPAAVKQAGDIFRELSLPNIVAHHGSFDEKIPEILNRSTGRLLVYLDGDHSYLPTIRYVRMCMEKGKNLCGIIVDDIRWSDEMEKAWKEIIGWREIRFSIDLFFMGILFLGERYHPGHFVVKF